MKNTAQSRVNKKAIRAALAVLGRTSKQIAASLRKRRCTGKPNDPFGCPLVTYLTRCFKGSMVSVGSDIQVGTIQILGTLAQSRFVHRFDNGEFPGLVRV